MHTQTILYIESIYKNYIQRYERKIFIYINNDITSKDKKEKNISEETFLQNISA